MDHPVICFGQQPCGIFPKRFLYAKIVTARRLQKELGGEIVFFYHDAAPDARESITVVEERSSGRGQALNIRFAVQLQKQFSPLYAMQLAPDCPAKATSGVPCH